MPRLTTLLLRRLTLCICLLAVLTNCATQPKLSPKVASSQPEAGQLIAIEDIGGYSELITDLILWFVGMSDRVPANYGFDMYRLTYWTTDESKGLTQATGLVSIPRAEKFKAVLGWQHGTAVTRDQVPSTPTPDEGLLVSIAFAGHGYVVFAPDYLGLGGSELDHPYYHAPTAASTNRDLLIALRSLLEESELHWPKSLFLTGFSQGGYNTMITLRDLEANPLPNIRVTAAAPIAGPFDLAGFSVPNALKGESPSASLYLAYIINSYARIYGENISSLVREPYASQLPALFDGTQDGDEVVAGLPQHPKELFHDQVWQEFENGNLGWLGERLRQNSAEEFLPGSPVRLYYGNQDLDVSPTEALNQVQRWRAEGLQIEAVDVGPFDHNESVIEAAPRVRDWFDEFLRTE